MSWGRIACGYCVPPCPPLRYARWRTATTWRRSITTRRRSSARQPNGLASTPRSPGGTRSGSKGNRENWHKERTTVANGDVPDGSKARDGSGGDGDEAAWLDLVARFASPSPAQGEVPWPDREDLVGSVAVPPSDELPRPEPVEGTPGAPRPTGQARPLLP